MVFASPVPSQAELATYNQYYFLTAHEGEPKSKSAIAFFAGIARIRYLFVNSFLEKHQIKVGSILEMGPGPGFFARNWLLDTPQRSYFAVETDESCHQALVASGVTLVDKADGVSTDLVIMSHVLEHVPDPVGFIRNATLGLRRGGVLFIEVPCRDFEHKAIDEPHLLFFDKVPMRRLLDDQGFTEIEIAYYGQTITDLKAVTKFQVIWAKLRAKLISFGVVAPFASISGGVEVLIDPLQRAVLRPSLAHRESSKPAWWLRVIARKI